MTQHSSTTATDTWAYFYGAIRRGTRHHEAGGSVCEGTPSGTIRQPRTPPLKLPTSVVGEHGVESEGRATDRGFYESLLEDATAG